MTWRGGRCRRAFGAAALPLLAALALPAGSAAQTDCPVPATSAWSGPLARQIRVETGHVPLRDALAHVANAARLRISYSLQPDRLDRAVCAAGNAVAVGDVLVALLRGVPVRPVATAGDHIVLAPAPANGNGEEDPDAEPEAGPVVTLQPIVVRADAARAASSREEVAVDVFDGEQLADAQRGELRDVLNVAAPGMYLWEGARLGVGYASIRGVSSFDATGPKVYIDGVQVADPLLLTRLSPESIERIEVVRGPQGTALYGADAISGVLDITTRGASSGRPGFGLRSTFGISATPFSPGNSIAHDHAFHFGIGSARRSATVDVAVGTSGEPFAGSHARHFEAGGALRFVGDRSLISGTVRYQAQREATTFAPSLTSEWAEDRPTSLALASMSTEALSVRHLTAGVRASFFSDGPWTHTFVAGIDGYALEGEAPELVAAGSLTRSVAGRAVRGTLRATSSARFSATRAVQGVFTATLEETLLRQGTLRDITLVAGDGIGASGRPIDASRNDTGAGVQLDLAIAGRWFLNGGVRLEYTDALPGINGVVALPAVGAAWTAIDGPVDVKLRTAWGKGIRWPELTTGGAGWEPTSIVYVPLDLGPEEQAGIEAGVDVEIGTAVSLRLTRFDQTASGLVQRVALPAAPNSSPLTFRPPWAYQNVGEITNRGWEVQATAARGPLAVMGSFATVDSRVQRLAWGYAGDLRAGDRMLGVPARTFGATVSWTGDGWSGSIAASRATDWIGYDRVALTGAMMDEATVLDGEDLRSYWRTYGGVTHLNAMFTKKLYGDVTLLLQGDNLLNYQTGEPDNATLMRGRTVSLGVRATF